MHKLYGFSTVDINILRCTKVNIHHTVNVRISTNQLQMTVLHNRSLYLLADQGNRLQSIILDSWS